MTAGLGEDSLSPSGIDTDTKPTHEQDETLPNDVDALHKLVKSLTHALGEVTKERDGLYESLSACCAREAEARDSLQAAVDKRTEIEAEVEQLRKKGQEDEEAITMLRSKVEESRYVLRVSLKILLTDDIFPKAWAHASAN